MKTRRPHGPAPAAGSLLCLCASGRSEPGGAEPLRTPAAADIVPIMAQRKNQNQPKVAISSTQKAIRVPRKGIADLVAFVSSAEGYRIADADIAVVDSAKMAELNRRYLRHAGATDVLSFDLSETPKIGLSVQLIVCGDVAAAEAGSRGLTPVRELLLYVVHGLLHLMGYEDESIRGSVRMQARQEELLEQFLNRPGRKENSRR
jgi:probable rRNA maturation factor